MRLEVIINAIETTLCILDVYKNDIFNDVVETIEDYVNYNSADNSDEIVSDFMEAIGNIKDINRASLLLRNLLQDYENELLIQQHDDE